MLVGNGIQYIPASFDDEAEIERVVQDQAELLFGSGSMYLSKVRISTAQGRGTIPDGYVIDLERGCWYFVEAERAAHGTWEHIAPQVARQLAALRQREARQAVLQLALKEIETSERLRRLLPELGLRELTVHGKIASILETPPVVAIPIDEVPQDLIDWATSLKNEVKIWKIDKYVREDTGETLYGIPDDTLPTLQTAPGKANLGTTKSQGGNWFQRVLKAGLLKPGDRLYMDYGPRGGTRSRFEATVRPDGVELDGKVYSPSYAAVHCMRKAGSDRRTANGWDCWHTMDGTVLTELADQLEDEDQPGRSDAPPQGH